MKKILAYIIMSYFTLSSNVLFATSTGGRDILHIGCHLNNNTCYVTISGSPVGPTTCSSTSVRWDEATSANGKSTLALLMAAFTAGKKVDFNIVDTCYGIYPTFGYIGVYR